MSATGGVQAGDGGHTHVPEFSAAGCACRGCRRPVVARYATPEEWAEVAALRDEVGALEAALAEAEALAEAVRVWANDPYRPDESAEQYMDRVGQLREDGILDALREFDARRAATAGQEG